MYLQIKCTLFKDTSFKPHIIHTQKNSKKIVLDQSYSPVQVVIKCYTLAQPIPPQMWIFEPPLTLAEGTVTVSFVSSNGLIKIWCWLWNSKSKKEYYFCLIGLEVRALSSGVLQRGWSCQGNRAYFLWIILLGHPFQIKKQKNILIIQMSFIIEIHQKSCLFT